jgi:hypothetical protein
VRVDFEFVFACVKMDITPKKRPKIVVFNKHKSMTVRDIACVVGVGKSSVSRIPEHFSPNKKGKCRRKRKNTPRTHQLLLRNGGLHPTMTSKHLHSDLLT